MARGTGLPLPQSDAVVQITPVSNAPVAAAYSNAESWARIANAGARLSAVGVDMIERETNRAQTGYLAGQEVEIARKRIELRDQFATDPDGFDRAWTAYSDGKLSQSEPWAVNHLKVQLGREGNAAYGAILNEKRGRDRTLDGQRVSDLIGQTSSEVIGAAMAGRLASPEAQGNLVKLQAVLDSAVATGLMDPESARIKLLETTSRAGAEATVKAVGDTYRANRAKGLEAGDLALKEAEDALLRTTDERLSGLSEEQRYAYYHKATSEIRALEAERKQDLALAKQAKQDAETAIANGIRPDDTTVSEIVDQLEKAGGHAEAARLRASMARYDRLSAFGRQPLADQVRQYTTLSGALEAIPPAEIASETGLAFIREAEGFTPTARFDVRQYSAGYGTKAAPGETVTREEAERRLRTEADKVAAYIAGNVKVPLTQMQHDALVSFGFNLGTDDLAKLLPDINAGNFERVAARMRSFNQVAGVPNEGVAARRTREAELFLGQPVTIGAPAVHGPGVDLRLVAGQRKILSKEAEEQWATIKTRLDDDVRPEPGELQAVIRAAALVGDHDLLEEIGARWDRFEAKTSAGRAGVALQKGSVAELQAVGAAEGLSAGQSAFLKDLEKTVAATQDKLANDPIALGAQRFPERFKVPDALDLRSPDAAAKGLAERTVIARFVGENYGEPNIPVLSQSDRSQIADAIASPTPQPENKAGARGGITTETAPDRAAIALDLLASLPDDNFAATLETKEIKAAVSGAARSADPAKFTAAMKSLDRMWTRAPEEVARIFGEDTIKSLQDWQAKLRYHNAEELADRLRKRDDPQVREQYRKAEEQGRRLASERTIDDIATDLDPGWLETGPDAPTDARTRAAALGDYQTLFSERYAETGDESTAHRQAIERMKRYWKRSEVNGGRLTLRAPETVYPAVNGSHDWMREQIVADLAGRNGGKAPSDFVVVADRITESEADARKPASYLVSTLNERGEWEIVRGGNNAPLRFKWDHQGPAESAREKFARQRAHVLNVDRNAPALTRAIRRGIRSLGVEPVIVGRETSAGTTVRQEVTESSLTAIKDLPPQALRDVTPEEIRTLIPPAQINARDAGGYAPTDRQSKNIQDMTPAPEYAKYNDDQLLEKYNNHVRKSKNQKSKADELEAKKILLEFYRRNMIDLTDRNAAAR